MIGKNQLTMENTKKPQVKNTIHFSEPSMVNENCYTNIQIFNSLLFEILTRVWETNKTKRGKDVPYDGIEQDIRLCRYDSYFTCYYR